MAVLPPKMNAACVVHKLAKKKKTTKESKEPFICAPACMLIHKSIEVANIKYGDR